MFKRFEMDRKTRRKVVEKHLCNDGEPWCRLGADLRERARTAEASGPESKHTMREEVEQIVASEASAAAQWPLYVEMRAKRVVRRKHSVTTDRLYIGPSGLLIATVCGSPERIRSAFFPAASASWRQTCRSLLIKYCRFGPSQFRLPDLSASFKQDSQCSAHREDRRVDRVTLHIAEHFGIPSSGVTQQTRISFPRWPEAERRGLDATVAAVTEAVRTVRTRNPRRPRNLDSSGR